MTLEKLDSGDRITIDLVTEGYSSQKGDDDQVLRGVMLTCNDYLDLNVKRSGASRPPAYVNLTVPETLDFIRELLSHLRALYKETPQ